MFPAVALGEMAAKYPCPCCGHLIFLEPPGSYDICEICFWEDDIVMLRWPTTGGQFSGLLAALREADLRVPTDFSVLSVIASQYAEMLTPALTSVEWPAFEAGRLAAEMLIERLRDDSAPPQQLLIGGDLTVRESTGPAPRVSSARRRDRASGRGAPRAAAR